MKIENLKQLEAVIKLCRKHGATDIKIDGIELHLSPLSNVKTNKRYAQDEVVTPTITPYVVTEETNIVEEVSKIATDELTEDQLMNWSVRQDEDMAEAQ